MLHCATARTFAWIIVLLLGFRRLTWFLFRLQKDLELNVISSVSLFKSHLHSILNYTFLFAYNGKTRTFYTVQKIL